MDADAIVLIKRREERFLNEQLDDLEMSLRLLRMQLLNLVNENVNCCKNFVNIVFLQNHMKLSCM